MPMYNVVIKANYKGKTSIFEDVIEARNKKTAKQLFINQFYAKIDPEIKNNGEILIGIKRDRR